MKNSLWNIYLFVCAVLMLSFASCGGGESALHGSAVDSLLHRLSTGRYSSLDALQGAADSLSVMTTDDEAQMIAANSRAYVAMMRMDYATAYDGYSAVSESSRCAIERLVADVGLMTVCYRVSENRLFFDHRADALSSIRRINEEVALLGDADRERFLRAKIEFGIVSICYFSNLSMQEEKQKALKYLSQNLEGCDDVQLRLYARMIIANNVRDDIERLRSLCRGVELAQSNGCRWLEANYNLLLAISLRDSLRLKGFKESLPEYAVLLNPGNIPDDALAMSLALKAADGFREYGDGYMNIEALSVAASCNTEYGRYDDALLYVESALALVNDYYRRYYPGDAALCGNSLVAYDEGAYAGMEADGVYDIPECMLSVRREASCAFAGLGDVEASGINRNAYLELLAGTRLNKHLESRVSIVEENASELDVLLLVAALLLLLVLSLSVVAYRRRRRHELLYSSNLDRLQVVCRRLLSSLSHEVDSKHALCDMLSNVLNDNLGDFSGVTMFSLAKPLENVPAGVGSFYEFGLQYMNGGEPDVLYVATEHPLIPEKYSVISMLVPYVAMAVEEGLRLSDISDERERVQEELRACSIYLAEHKRENLLKRVSVSVVTGMRPYMDRMIRELDALPAVGSSADAERKLQYISELADRLDELNVVLERWIKMRKGDLNLQVENFPVADIFGIVEKSRALLERRGIELVVNNDTSVVKADKALTLFMVNTLVDNASKFTPKGGVVTVESTEGDGYVEIAVSDTGVGMSQGDIERILGEKVYDASEIGKDNTLLQKDRKGGGFGLMNCKGIIDKYRKTDSLFSVCSMDIKSTKGKGSRFSFRLPKGVVRAVLVLMMLLPGSAFAGSDLLGRVSACADSVYFCNVEGEYAQALVHAQNAVELLNEYYKENVGGTDTLSLLSGVTSELKWWREALFADSLLEGIYYNILDIRNEATVASLALQHWSAYRFNNYIYTTLYRLVHEDKGIADRYEAAVSRLNYRVAAIALLFFMLVVVLLYNIVSYVRHSVIVRSNERMLLDVNHRLLQVAADRRRATDGLLQAIVDEIYGCMGENMRMSSVAMMLRKEAHGEAVTARAGEEQQLYGNDNIFMLGVIDSGMQYTSPDRLRRVLPLYVVLSGERCLIGALEVVTMRPLVNDEILNIELVASYAASVAYHALVRVADSYMELDGMEEETERLRYEENRLHVQNMVLDNCLSALKHETVYYPSRIRELAGQALRGGEGSKAIPAMGELMEYYASIFGILSNCARRELDDRCFMVSKVGLQTLFDSAAAYMKRRAKRLGLDVTLSVEPTVAMVSVDSNLVEYLFESLIDAALKVGKEGALKLRALDDGGDAVKVELIDTRREVASDELADMFMPTFRNLSPDGTLVGMEYLVAKEIVRLHEDNTGHRGSRMEARSDVAGTVILFTLPK